MLRAVGLLLLLPSLLVGWLLYTVNQYPEVPDIRLEYWAEGPAEEDDKTLRPFRIDVPNRELNGLLERLSLPSKLFPPLQDVTGFQYGTNTNYMREFLDYWRTEYNWTERQDYLNQYSQYKTQIGGLDIHFLHVKPDPKLAQGMKVLPLLVVHGWPGSVREFYDFIPLLTSPRTGFNFVFEVVVPSLPGFGFSDAAKRSGMGPPQMATIMAELMSRLGFKQFYYQAGDWGALIGHSLAVLFPQRVLGFHCNFCLAVSAPARLQTFHAWLLPSLLVEEPWQEKFMNQFYDSFILESGYYHLQATKPDTIGVALTDSPSGLAAYILEKFSSMTNKNYRELKDGGLSTYKKHDLLDNIMIYWLTGSMTSAMRIYSENYVKKSHSLEISGQPVKIPTHCARFPHEVIFYPRIALEQQYKNLVSVTDFPTGGHFAAFEQPKLLADDVWNFVKRLKSNEA